MQEIERKTAEAYEAINSAMVKLMELQTLIDKAYGNMSYSKVYERQIAREKALKRSEINYYAVQHCVRAIKALCRAHKIPIPEYITLIDV